MKYVYLDWNVFDRIEKIEHPGDSKWEVFSKIEKLIKEEAIISPYSNAHINDLVRGYHNNPTFVPKHLDTLKRLTRNLCIVQYWGKNQTTWHYRDVEEFFTTALEDFETSYSSFESLLDSDETGLMKSAIAIMRLTPVPSNFKDIYKVDPIFTALYPRIKTEMNMLALAEDIFDFSQSAKKDYNLYKSLRLFVNQSRAKLKKQEKMFKQIDKSMEGIPEQLNFDDAWETYAPKANPKDNPAYHKITNTYYKIDFKGFKSDERFSNLIDDSLHVFYGAHCDYFISLDNKCLYKAIETYKQLGITTKAMNPNEFIESWSEGNQRKSSTVNNV